MALAHSPQVVTDGLVFYYDMGNPQKSWKGAPTTNSVTNALAMTGWNNYSNGTPVAITTSLGTPGYGFYNAGSWNGIYRSITIPSTGIYTFSAWVKYIGGSTNNNGGGVYISGWGGGDSATVTNRTLPGQWQRVSITLNCTNTTFNFFLISWGGTNGADNSSWEMTMPQAEPGSFATPFVNGTRSNTQAIVDLTNNNAITTDSLTYNSDGTFSFNGSSNFMTFTENPALNTQTPTVEVWVKTNATTQNGFWFEKGTVNGQYALFQEGGSIQWRMNIGGVTNLSTTTATYMNTSNWYQVVGTYTSGTRRLYINGTLVNSDTQTGVIATNTNGCSIGVYGGFNGSRGYYYNGNISLVKVYNRALTASEVQQNFNALRGRYGI
jgi:hypothetical protein